MYSMHTQSTKAGNTASEDYNTHHRKTTQISCQEQMYFELKDTNITFRNIN